MIRATQAYARLREHTQTLTGSSGPTCQALRLSQQCCRKTPM